MVSFSVLSLFSSGEQGVWYDPSDFLPNWRLNLLTRSEEFDNAAWTKTGATIAANATTDPTGGSSADKLVEDAATSNHNVAQGISAVSGVMYTASIYVKKAERSFVIFGFDGPGYSSLVHAVSVNLNTFAISTATGSPENVSVEDVGNGWCRVSVSKAATASALAYMTVRLSADGVWANRSYAGDGTSGAFVWGADLRLTSNASVAPTYQKITDGIQDYLTYQPQPVMFQDAAGTTPVTAVEQPVGLILDKSKALAIGAELRGTGTSGITGTATAASYNTETGAGSVSRVDAFNQSFVSFAVTSGRTYLFTIQNTGSVSLSIRNSALGSAFVSVASGTTTTARITANDAALRVCASGDASTALFTVTSVKEIAGNHASQSTSASRPVLSARVNLLTYSEQFDNAAWTKGNTTITPNAIVAPDGTTTADTIAASTTGIFRYAHQSPTLTQGTTYTFSAYIKTKTAQWVWLLGETSADAIALFDVVNGVVGSKTAGLTSSITSVGNGWYLCSITFAVSSVTGVQQIGIGVSDSNTTINPPATAGIDAYIWGADLRVTNAGVSLPAYQRIAAATDYDTTGFPLYLKFDGTDDGLATGTIDPGSVDKAQVFAGVRKLSDAGFPMIVELSALSTANNGAFALNGNSAGYTFQSFGTVLAQASTSTGNAAPISNVLTGLADISGDSVSWRSNGVVAATTVTDQGTGNYGSYPLYIGRRGGSTLPYNGHLYGLIVRFSAANASAAQIASTEAYMNNLTKAY